MKHWNIKFWLPGKMPAGENVFGCSTYGYATHTSWFNPEDTPVYTWNFTPVGEVLSGSYSEVYEQLKEITFVPKAIVTVFTAKSGMEDFLSACKELMGSVPFVGGGAAIGSGQTAGEILPNAKDVSMLLIAEGEFLSSFQNIHEDRLLNIVIEPAGERIIKNIRILPDGIWIDAVDFYRTCRATKGIAENDFETITFSDLKNRNVHCSIVNNELKVNANLPKDNKMLLRTVSRDEATQRFSKFISEENALVFSCAGLRSLYNKKVYAGENTFAGFFFGETATIGNDACFGNLILSKLVHIP